MPSQLLQLPWLKIVGAVLLLWIGIQLLVDNDGDAEVHGHVSLLGAIRTILVADLVMSLDNVIAVAAAASSAPEHLRVPLLVIGLGLSIPLIIFGSTLLLKLMERFPVIITLGPPLLGFVAGEMAVTDAFVHDWVNTHLHELDRPSASPARCLSWQWACGWRGGIAAARHKQRQRPKIGAMGAKSLFQRLLGRPRADAGEASTIPIAQSTLAPGPPMARPARHPADAGEGLRAVGRDRPGRHGRGLQGHAAGHRPPGGHQAIGLAARVRARRPAGRARPLHARGARGRPAAPPEILEVVDAGQDGADAWIAFEYVLGRDLASFTRPEQLLPVARSAADRRPPGARLAYAHSHGVVHRDIKPANVMLDRVNGSLKLMDFGIARIADGSRTRTGLVLGTPSFMSPEQLAGLQVDGRSDLYSLGVLLYQLVCGRPPHHGDSMARLMYQIANKPRPTSAVSGPTCPRPSPWCWPWPWKSAPSCATRTASRWRATSTPSSRCSPAMPPAPSGWTPMSPSRLSHKPCACRQGKQGRIRPPPIRKFRPPAHDSGVLQCH